MSRYEEVTLRLGFGDRVEEVKVTVGPDRLAPWDLDDRFAVVGRRLDRHDAVAKVTGRARYTYDQRPDGLIYGRILRSPHANADVVKVDLEKARTLPGVRAVLDLTELFRSKSVRYAGEEIAAVAADTEAEAEAALRAIEVAYEVRPFAVTTEAAMKPDAPQVGRGGQANVEVPSSRTFRRSRDEDGEEARARLEKHEAEQLERWRQTTAIAHRSFEQRFETQVQTHTSLETHGVVCRWEGDELTCWASTQATFSVRGELQQTTGAAGVRVLAEYVGGGFGSKFGAGREGVTCAHLAREAGRPVKLMLDRREEHLAVGNRPDSIQDIAMAVDEKGKIIAYRARTWGTPGYTGQNAGAANDAMYDLGEVDKLDFAVRTNTGSQRAMRAPGFPQGAFALEQMMDIAALELGMDPVAFRKLNDRHKIRPHEFDMGAERIGWEKARKVLPGAGKGPVKTGVGCAGSVWFARGGPGATVRVRVFPDGRVEARNGSQDIGTGTRTIMAMCVAEEMGIPAERITTFIGDTEDPPGPGSGGSTTAPTLTPAARLAGARAREGLVALAAARLGRPAEELTIREGRVARRDGRPLADAPAFEALCAAMEDDVLEFQGASTRADMPGFSPQNAGVQFAEVEVDTDTGEVRVKRVVAVADCGKVINAKTAESQVRGGVIQGVSYALFENRVMDPQRGLMLNADMESYLIAGPVDCPVIDTVLLDVANGFNATSVMGLGEPPIIATAAAIANAVHHAIGVRIPSLPITPKKILEALENGRKR